MDNNGFSEISIAEGQNFALKQQGASHTHSETHKNRNTHTVNARVAVNEDRLQSYTLRDESR